MGFCPALRETGGVKEDPFQYWTAQEIADATSCPVSSVQDNWPLVWGALHDNGLSSKGSQAGALGTIAVETASTFRPLHEYGGPADWAGYSGGSAYAGRGYIQLTHDYNYRSAGTFLGLDLVSNPDSAMDPAVAAGIFAWYWGSHNCNVLADSNDWTAVRRAVVGQVSAPPGLDRLVQVVRRLGL